MREYSPDKWVIIKTPECHKIFACWRGGYLDGDSWRCSSAIKDVREDGDWLYFGGFSGSTYICNKKTYGASSYGASVLNMWQNVSNQNDRKDAIEVLGSWGECDLLK